MTLACLLAAGFLNFAAADWRPAARHLVGGGDGARGKAAKELARSKTLDDDLRRALGGPDRFLALDVIAALKRQSLLEDVVDFSAADPSGFSYLALNALIDQANVRRLSALYLERLAARTTPAPARLILVDTLARMHVPLPDETWRRLLNDASPEVRGAALSSLRALLLREENGRALALFRDFLLAENLSRQLRLQALYVLKELPEKSARGLRPPCPEAVPAALAKLCPSARRET